VYLIVHQHEGTATLQALPLAAGLLVASVRADAELAGAVEAVIEVERRAPEEVVGAYARAPDVLAFSLYTWNTRYSLAVARLAKRAFPAVRVVMGGPSVPRRRGRIARWLAEHDFTDALVLGEGEVTFPELLKAWRRGEDAREVAGLALRAPEAPDGCVVTAPRPRLREFSAAASPFLDGTFDGLLERHGRRLSAAVLETNRGCPFACTFCDWGQATASRVNELPAERVLAELEWIGARGIPYLYIVDANFGIRPRDLGLVQHLGEVKRRYGAPGNCYFHLTKNANEKNLRTVETLRDAGLGCQVALSMQDFDEAVLEAIARRNIHLERSLALRRLCNRRGIPTFNELLLGLPEQSYGSFCASLVQAITPYPGDSFFLYLTRLLENAEMASPEHRERYGLETRSCLIGDSHRPAVEDFVPEREEVVVATRAMPVEDWRRAFRFGYLLGALYNLRLADAVIQWLRRGLGLDLRGWVEAVLQAAEEGPVGAALWEVGAALSRYAEAVLEGVAFVLPIEGLGEHRWAPVEAVAHVALTRREGFYGELRDVTGAWLGACGWGGEELLVEEVFAFQELRLPGPDRSLPEERTFAHDWVDFMAQTEVERPAPVRRATRLRHVPPATVTLSAGRRSFLFAHLAMLYDKGGRGCVERVDGEPGPSRPASSASASSASAAGSAASRASVQAVTPSASLAAQKAGGST
jgi:radical SAM superfamily enzyme YgiQ (UPF0313 family)